MPWSYGARLSIKMCKINSGSWYDIKCLAVLIMLENIRNVLDNNECAIGIFLDFQNVYDTVDHDIVLDKLYDFGIREIVLEWFKSYMSNRCRVVKYDYESEARKYCAESHSGLYQAYFCSWFLQTINPWPVVYSCLYHLLMTPIVRTNDKLEIIANEINVELLKIYTSVKVNKLLLNIENTDFRENAGIFS